MARRDISYNTIARKLRKVLGPYRHLRVCLLKDIEKNIYSVEVRAKNINNVYKVIYWTQITDILNVIKDYKCIAFINADKDIPIIHIHKIVT